MEDAPSTKGHGRQPKPRCGARRRDGGTCRNGAGARTDHPGVGFCANHGGSTPTHQVAAERVVAEQAVAATAARFGLDLDDTPLDEIALREIRRSSAMVGQLARMLSELSAEELTFGVAGRDIRHPGQPGDQPGGQQQLDVQVHQRARVHPLVKMHSDERDQLRAWMVAAHQAGVRERLVRQVQLEGQLMADLVNAILSDPELEMRPEQVARFGVVVPRHLRRMDVIERGEGAG
jgi:hypothetical protein